MLEHLSLALDDRANSLARSMQLTRESGARHSHVPFKLLVDGTVCTSLTMRANMITVSANRWVLSWSHILETITLVSNLPRNDVRYMCTIISETV